MLKLATNLRQSQRHGLACALVTDLACRCLGVAGGEDKSRWARTEVEKWFRAEHAPKVGKWVILEPD